jgi:hypothetical protein
VKISFNWVLVFAHFIILSMSLAISPAFAGEGFFGRTYTTDTEPAGHFEIEQVVRNRTGRAFGRYTAFDFRTELEYGITDQFQAAFYLNNGYIHAVGSPDDDDPNGSTGFNRSRWFMQGISLEFIYRVLSPITDPVGLAFYYEPAIAFHDLHNGLPYDTTFENEWRMILQKNFLDDTLVLAYNLTLETEFIRFEGEESWASELDLNNELGATYRFAANWFAGLEFRNHNEIGNFNTHEHSVFWLGPVIHYGGTHFWGTLSVLKQVSGNPNGLDADGTQVGDGGLFLRSHENWETTLKVAVPL